MSWLKIARLLPKKLKYWVLISCAADYTKANPKVSIPGLSIMDCAEFLEEQND